MAGLVDGRASVDTMNGWIGSRWPDGRWMPRMIPQHNNYNYQVGKEGIEISALSNLKCSPSEWLIHHVIFSSRLALPERGF